MDEIFISGLIFLLTFDYTVSTPCQRYQVLEMYDGLRHIEAERSENNWKICDHLYVDADNWYRLLLNGENFDVAERCEPLGSCNTFAPIWMLGGYPEKAGVITENTMCVNYVWSEGDPGNCTCDPLSKTVDVQLCEGGHGGNFFIHRFKEMPECNSAICIQNRTTNLTEFEGNRVSCNKEVEDCSSITVVLNETLTDLSVECVFLGEKSVTLKPLWASPSVIQCEVPTVNYRSGAQTVNGLYSLNIVETADPTDVKQTVDYLLFDSTCEICNDNFTCIYQNGTCVINGQCLAGDQCDVPSTSTSTHEGDDEESEISFVLLISTLTISLFTLCLVTILIACYWKRAKQQRRIDDMT